MKLRKIVTGIIASALMACSLSAVSANAVIIKSMPMKGDLNGDKVINEADLKIMTNNLANGFHIANLVIYHAADVNWDGKVNISDLQVLNKYVKGEKKAIHTGDVTGDKRVDEADVKVVLAAVNSPTPKYLYQADVNGNGKLDILDVFSLRNYITL